MGGLEYYDDTCGGMRCLPGEDVYWPYPVMLRD